MRHATLALALSLGISVALGACAPARADAPEGQPSDRDLTVAAEDPAIDEGAIGTPDTVDTIEGSLDVDGAVAASGGARTVVVPTADDLKALAATPIQFQHILSGKRVVELPLGLAKADLEITSGGAALYNPLIELGNLLFFDKRLSENKAMACASCHLPSRGFAMSGRPFGVHGNALPRVAPSAANRAFGLENTWLGGRTLEQQSTAPFLNRDEMALTPTSLIDTVRAISGYSTRFDRLVADGTLAAPAISQTNIGVAIAAFQRSLMSGASRVDQYEAGVRSALNGAEIAGRALFHGRGRCVLCHSGTTYTDEGFHNIASGCPEGSGDCVHPTPSFEAGRYLVTRQLADLGKWKTPSLRNVGVRGPYFHNGHDATLKVVVHGYNVAGDLDAIIGQDPALIDLGLSSSEEDQIIAFLNALTGTVAISASLSQAGTTTSSPLREHYLLSPRVFRASYYRAANPDIAGIAAMTDDDLRRHWIDVGASQGRPAVERFHAKEYQTYRVRRGLATTAAVDGYRPVIEHYLEAGLRDGEELWGRFALQPDFFDYEAYRTMNPARLALASRAEVIWDFLTFGLANKLGGRSTYATGARFRIKVGTYYRVEAGNTYCEMAGYVPTGHELSWPYVPSNLTSIGACAP